MDAVFLVLATLFFLLSWPLAEYCERAKAPNCNSWKERNVIALCSWWSTLAGFTGVFICSAAQAAGVLDDI